MNHTQFQRQIAECRARAADGDTSAVAEFRRTYGPCLERIVGRIARKGRAASDFERQVLRKLEETRRMNPGRPGLPEAVRDVAGRMLELMLEGPDGSPADQTVRRAHRTVFVS